VLLADDGFPAAVAEAAPEMLALFIPVMGEDGQHAVTHFRRLRCNEKYSLEEIHLETGRTHQIRVHFAHIGNPLAGDDMYGGKRENIARQALHCGELEFAEPLTGEIIKVKSQLPDDIVRLFDGGII